MSADYTATPGLLVELTQHTRLDVTIESQPIGVRLIISTRNGITALQAECVDIDHACEVAVGYLRGVRAEMERGLSMRPDAAPCEP